MSFLTLGAYRDAIDMALDGDPNNGVAGGAFTGVLDSYFPSASNDRVVDAGDLRGRVRMCLWEVLQVVPSLPAHRVVVALSCARMSRAVGDFAFADEVEKVCVFRGSGKVR